MCLNRNALNALAGVTAGRVYRRRSPAPRPLRVGNQKSPNVCSDSVVLLADMFQALVESSPTPVHEREEQETERVAQGPQREDTNVDHGLHRAEA